MTRLEVRERFRAENPELDDNVISDAILNTWALYGNREICAITRCIVTNQAETFNATIDRQYYDLSALIDNFFEIDEIPGGGVYYNDAPLKKATPAEMNQIKRLWRENESGTPKRWWRRGKYLWFDRAPDDDLEIALDCVLLPEDFDNDAESPYNSLEHLQPYEDGVSKYIQWRAKQKVGKQEEAAIAKKDFFDYTSWMKKMVSGYSQSAIYRRPSSGSSS